MAAVNGREMRIKLGNGASPEVFTAIAGAREESISAENGEIDITNKDSLGYRTLLTGGTRTLSLSCSGVAENDVLFQAFIDGTIANYEIEFGDGGELAGAFQIRSYERTGEHADAETFSATIESSGVFSYTPGP